MPTELIPRVLNCYEAMWKLHSPIINVRVANSVIALCNHPTLMVFNKEMLGFLCSLTSSELMNTSYTISMATTRLLDIGIRKVYLVNREICVIKLPVVFRALAGLSTCLALSFCLWEGWD